ncbi:MAG TPA: DNA double-strand break repair nuclease NurA [Anaerolineales bacterium]|nr:DNA double-strand break repair nuclease NurA [Anaerolineales bacterium]
MALELNRVLPEVDLLSANAAERLAELSARLPSARARLAEIGSADAALRARVQTALGMRWAGAIPTEEPVDASYPCPPAPARFDVLAADGSQIYPDRHGIALYYLINTGSIAFRHGSGQAPDCRTEPRLHYADADLYEEDGGQIPSFKIDADRDLAELGELVQLAGEQVATPTVALIDNGLLLYITLQSPNRGYADAIVEGYLAHLDALKAAGANPAGVVDRPRAASVVRLLRLAELGADQINDQALRDLGPYRHMTDGLLFADLAPGHRSALFEHGSPANQDSYKPRGHSIYLFYVRSGDTLLRVEVPAWVAQNPERLDFVHAAIVKQGELTGGFPYVLMRAHEIAVVTHAERRLLDEALHTALIRRGLSPSISQKQQGKAWTSSAKQKYG